MSKNQNEPAEPTLAELQKRVAKGRALLAEIRALFPEAHALDDRRRSQGRLDEAVRRATIPSSWHIACGRPLGARLQGV